VSSDNYRRVDDRRCNGSTRSVGEPCHVYWCWLCDFRMSTRLGQYAYYATTL